LSAMEMVLLPLQACLYLLSRHENAASRVGSVAQDAPCVPAHLQASNDLS